MLPANRRRLLVGPFRSPHRRGPGGIAVPGRSWRAVGGRWRQPAGGRAQVKPRRSRSVSTGSLPGVYDPPVEDQSPVGRRDDFARPSGFRVPHQCQLGEGAIAVAVADDREIVGPRIVEAHRGIVAVGRPGRGDGERPVREVVGTDRVENVGAGPHDGLVFRRRPRRMQHPAGIAAGGGDSRHRLVHDHAGNGVQRHGEGGGEGDQEDPEGQQPLHHELSPQPSRSMAGSVRLCGASSTIVSGW